MTTVFEWFEGLPVFTKYWVAFSTVFSLIGRFRLMNVVNFFLIYEPFIKGFQIWRAFTCLFYYPLNFHWMMNMYFLYNYSLRLEKKEYDGRPADYFYLLIFNWACCIVAAILLNFPLLMNAMIVSIIYVWCQLNKDVIVQFWFGLRFQAMYLPWVLLAVNFITNHDATEELIGILCGHLYFFLKFKYPQEFGGPSLLNTPAILEYYFPPTSNVRGFGAAPSQNTGNIHRGHVWGAGRVLGD
ncbi:unnamed protein product [Trichogramma brassicae]|uniref:Derlin n=1 Tax=Trichogramma brassicae TaxID=86971 RepID=A0A6H5I927_9HYME|nr:unnamed protein product [Trichogramma brassicae]